MKRRYEPVQFGEAHAGHRYRDAEASDQFPIRRQNGDGAPHHFLDVLFVCLGLAALSRLLENFHQRVDIDDRRFGEFGQG